MPGQSQRYSRSAIRDLLLDAFNAEELHDLFYFADAPDLHAVVQQFREDDSLPAMVSKAVRYCDSRSLLAEMLAEAAQKNPRKYREYEPRLYRAEPRVAVRDAADEAAERATQQRQELEARLDDLYRQAADRLKERNWAGACELLVRIDEIEPGYRNTLALLRQAETEQARTEQVDGLMAQGLVHLRAGEWILANESFRQVLALAPDHTEALDRLAESDRQERVAGRLDLGRGHLGTARWSEAISCFQAVLEIEPAHPEATKLLAEAQAEDRARRKEEARQAEQERKQAEDRARREEQARQAERARQEAADRAKREEQAREAELFPFYYNACLAAWRKKWPAAISGFEAILLRDLNYRDAAARLKEVRALQASEQQRPTWLAGVSTASQSAWLTGPKLEIPLGPKPPEDVLQKLQAIQAAGKPQPQKGSAAAPPPAEWRTVAELRGHTDDVNSVAFSPDGKLVVTGSDDKTARIWDAATGKEQVKLGRHSDLVHDATFSPDGRLVVTASGDGRARLWQASTGEMVTEIRVHRKIILGMGWQSVLSVAFSPDGQRLATASSDGKVRLWSVATGELEAELGGEEESGIRARFSPGGDWLITANRDGTARYWAVKTGKCAAELRGHTGELKAAVYSPDGKRVATGGKDGTARVWDVATGKVLCALRVQRDFGVYGVALHPNGKWLATVAFGKKACVWDIETGTRVAELHGHVSFPVSVAFSPDGRRAVTGGQDCTARVWEVPAS